MVTILQIARLLVRSAHPSSKRDGKQMAMLGKGDKAPEIEAVATDGGTFRLADYRGRSNVLIYFYPMDDTPGCTRQACSLRDASPDFDRADTLIVGVSTDDLESHRKFAEKYSLNFPLLVDTSRTICRAFGVPCEAAAKRASFLIDKSGTIAEVWGTVDVRSHPDEVLQAVRKLSVGRES